MLVPMSGAEEHAAAFKSKYTGSERRFQVYIRNGNYMVDIPAKIYTRKETAGSRTSKIPSICLLGQA